VLLVEQVRGLGLQGPEDRTNLDRCRSRGSELRRAEIRARLEKIKWRLEACELSDSVRTGSGYHLITVMDRVTKAMPDFEREVNTSRAAPQQGDSRCGE
jgi:hypothetical protein